MTRAMRERMVQELTELLLERGYLVVVCANSRSSKFYRLTLLPTLWGEVNLLREWGRRHAIRPQHQLEHHQGAAELRRSVAMVLMQRLRHGYRAA